MSNGWNLNNRGASEEDSRQSSTIEEAQQVSEYDANIGDNADYLLNFSFEQLGYNSID